MGVLYELNWYLVVASKLDLKEHLGNNYLTIKNEKRIYPIGAPIPIIIKEVGCIGMIEIENFKVTKETTEIEFQFTEQFDIQDPISNHYYQMYKSIKQV